MKLHVRNLVHKELIIQNIFTSYNSISIIMYFKKLEIPRVYDIKYDKQLIYLL